MRQIEIILPVRLMAGTVDACRNQSLYFLENPLASTDA